MPDVSLSFLFFPQPAPRARNFIWRIMAMADIKSDHDHTARDNSQDTPHCQNSDAMLTRNSIQVKRTVKLVTEQNPTYVSLFSFVAAVNFALPPCPFAVLNTDVFTPP